MQERGFSIVAGWHFCNSDDENNQGGSRVGGKKGQKRKRE